MSGPARSSVFTGMPRVVAAEALDGLAADDLSAMRSRRDLQRVHRVMGSRAIVASALRSLTTLHRPAAPLRVLELGAGDGTLMLGVARSLKPHWPTVELELLDRQQLVSPATLRAYAALGWQTRARVGDVFDWVSGGSGPRPQRWDLIVVNLFLHHFEGAPLKSILGAVAQRSHRFFACEPRRSRLALAGSHLIGLMGANSVTREDAVLSVHAGFAQGEMAALWPPGGAGWTLKDYPAGLFSHCFFASRSPPQTRAGA
ncbi:MAG: hypothetical protein ABIR35_12385 [Polaromonas sp.]